MNALILIDIQNDFLPGGSLEVPKGDEIIDNVNSIMDNYNIVVATKDWHPKDHISFASNHKNKNVGIEFLMIFGRFAIGILMQNVKNQFCTLFLRGRVDRDSNFQNSS